jgi:hypothetical protein
LLRAALAGKVAVAAAVVEVTEVAAAAQVPRLFYG